MTVREAKIKQMSRLQKDVKEFFQLPEAEKLKAQLWMRDMVGDGVLKDLEKAKAIFDEIADGEYKTACKCASYHVLDQLDTKTLKTGMTLLRTIASHHIARAARMAVGGDDETAEVADLHRHVMMGAWSHIREIVREREENAPLDTEEVE